MSNGDDETTIVTLSPQALSLAFDLVAVRATRLTPRRPQSPRRRHHALCAEQRLVGHPRSCLGRQARPRLQASDYGVHYLFTGTQITARGGPFQGTRQIDGGTWRPYLLVTPAFPEYVSAQSAASAASVAILRHATGSSDFGLSHTQPAGTSSIEPGLTPATDVTLSWDTFSDAANQAGLSRRYGGIHFEEGDLHGRALGAAVAGVVWDRAQYYITGGASLNRTSRTKRKYSRDYSG
jgi:hypothetical protein